MRQFNFLLITNIWICLFLAGCVQVIEEYPQKKTQLAVSSVRDLPIKFEIGSKFALSPKHIAEASLKPEQIKVVYHQYSNEIITNFQQKGFELSQTNQDIDFYVGFLLALSEDLNDKTINEKFGVSPGLGGNNKDDKGSLLIYVDDAKTGQRVWRGTAQGFIQQDFSAEDRKQRITKVVGMLLSQYHADK